ncbi:MHC class II transactivator isoform X2 [Amia ocellicauda]
MEAPIMPELELLYTDPFALDDDLLISSEDSFTDDEGNQLPLATNFMDLLCSLDPETSSLWEDCNSQSSYPLEDRENIERIIKFLQDDPTDVPTGEIETSPATAEADSSDAPCHETKVKSTKLGKRDQKSAGINCGDTTKPKRRKRGCSLQQRAQKMKHKIIRTQNNQGISPSAPTSAFLTFSASQGVFHINSNPVQHVVHVPFSSLTAKGNATLFTHCANGPAVQVFQTFTALPPQVINIPVGNTVNPGGATYVWVPPASLPSPKPQNPPSSPEPGTVVSADLANHLVNHALLNSSSDSISASLSPSSASPQSSTTESGLSPPPPQLVQTPEKPKCVEDYIESLKSFMLDNCQLMSMETEIALERLYVDVPLVQRQIKTKPGKHGNKYLEKELVICDIAETRKFAIQRNELFEDTDQKPAKVIALLGKAGMGKSTFIQKLCQDWANGDYQRFEFVFSFESKRLNVPGETFSLRSLLFDPLTSPPGTNAHKVFRYILDNPQKVLIIFDGFDDFQDSEGLLHNPATSHTKATYSIKQLFSGLFQKKLLAGSTLLIAARPKEVLNQFLGKVNKIVELCGFSEEEIELYMARYFNGTSYSDGGWKTVKNNRFLFSLCYNPLICRFVCFLLEHVDENQSLPSTLTHLYQQVLHYKLHMNLPEADTSKKQQQQHIPKLGALAWAGVKNHTCLLNQEDLASTELREFGLSGGVFIPFSLRHSNGEEQFGHGFAHLLMQNFLAALYITMSKQLTDKGLVNQMVLQQKKKKPQSEWLDVTRWFMMGLLFQKIPPFLDSFPDGTVNTMAKRNAMEDYLKKMNPSDLNGNRLLELCHCVYESQNMKLIKDLVQKLPEKISGAQLTPPDVFFLHYFLKKVKETTKTFSVDLQESGINLCGLKELVGLKCVTSFRASISDTISLWEHLQHTGEKELLKKAVAKFTINPFKAKRITDVENLALLVQIYRQKKLIHCDSGDPESNLDEDTFHIPAVENLHDLEFALGPQNGSLGFLGLVEILPSLQWLKHLDLESLTDNKIGDMEAEKLAEVLPALSSLETLNLSQNCIGDKGAEKLAQALPSLMSLRSLSLYSNLIGDSGAENVAKVLPEMKSLMDLNVKYNKITDVGALKLSESLKGCPWIKSIAMWNESIPHGVLEHLKQQDSRINTL